jgi:hypothetical protein
VGVTDSVAREVLDCVCGTFLDAERPVCDCYASIGVPVIYSCCECDEDGTTGNAIMQVEQIYNVDADLNAVDNRIASCRKGIRALDLTIWITRCYPTIDEDGEFDSTALDTAATEAHDDMDILYKAFACCYEGRLKIRRIAVDSEPAAGCSMIVGQVTVELPATISTPPTSS